MILRRLFAPILTLALLAAAPAAAEPLPLSELLRLSQAGVGEPVLLSLAKTQGLHGPLIPAQVLEMEKAGWSDQLMATLTEFLPSACSILPRSTLLLRTFRRLISPPG